MPVSAENDTETTCAYWADAAAGAPLATALPTISDGAAVELLDLAGDALILTGYDGRIKLFNRVAEAVFGYKAGEVLGQSINRLIPDRFHDSHDRHMRRFRTQESPPRLMGERQTITGRRRNGQEFPAEASIATVAAEGGGFLVVLRDVSSRIEVEQRTAQLGRIIEQSSNEIFVFDGDSLTFTLTNRAVRDNLGYSAGQLAGMTLLDVAPELTPNRLAALLQPLRDGRQEDIQYHTALQRRDGSTYEIEIRVQWLPTETPPVFVAIGRDISERSRYEALIRRHHYYDELTLLPNRTLCLERLEQTLRSGNSGQGAVVVIELDGIKLVGDSLGAELADQLVAACALRLERGVRPRDTLARLSSGEFVLIADGIGNAAGAAALAQNLIAALEPPFLLAGQPVTVQCFAGITLFPEDGDQPQRLLANATAAAWAARSQDTTQYRFFTKALNSALKHRLTLKSGLAGALERGEFSLAYQAKIDLAGWRVCGFEALLRWRHPELGAVPPDQFIPVLEETGQILAVGDWVLNTACAQQAAITAAGYHGLSMAVNLSVRQLQPGLPAAIAAALAAHHLRPEELELEVTESLLMREERRAAALLKTIADTGVQLAMDDFGSGYSSLANLKRLPLNSLKIDRNFIADLADDSADGTIIRAIIGMGRSLRLRIVAEGVETNQQLAVLQHLGCDQVQGYLFSRPIAGADLPALLATWNRPTGG